MRPFISKYWYILLLTVVGMAGGFLYWHFKGCISGSCIITSNWHTSSVMGGLMGYLGGSIVYDWVRKKPGL